jgi:hypothetical protein
MGASGASAAISSAGSCSLLVAAGPIAKPAGSLVCLHALEEENDELKGRKRDRDDFSFPTFLIRENEVFTGADMLYGEAALLTDDEGVRQKGCNVSSSPGTFPRTAAF